MDQIESLISEEKSQKGLIEDETFDLLSLYDIEHPTKEDVTNLLDQHHDRFGRIGFNSPFNNETVDYVHRYFTHAPKEYLNVERDFIREVMSSDLQSVIGEGIIRARSLVPEQEYESPQAVLLLNGKRTDAKVLGNRQFGINLQNLFGKVYSRESSTYNLQKALQIIKNNSAHEATHILEEQVEHTENVKLSNLIVAAFNEGLATFSEESHYFPWSEDYLNDSENTIEIIKEVLRHEPKVKIISDICNMRSLKKHQPDDIKNAENLIKKGNISDEDFKSTVFGLLVAKNGPLYYAGCAVWRKMYEIGGIEKVREVAKRGPNAFMEF